MSYRVEWTPRAARELLAVEKKQRLMIVSWVDKNLEGCENPKSIPGPKSIRGTRAGWRYRIGNYRILATVNSDVLTINVVRVGHRREVYRSLPNGL